MTQTENAKTFAALHRPGDPLVLFNIWDTGSAAAVASAGAKALATGSHSVAEAQGWPDGENLPLETLLAVATRITATSKLPLSVDFETGFAREPERLADNVSRLLATGAVGINFEDQLIGGETENGLYPVYPLVEQINRLRAVRAAAQAADIDLFINARTDLFLRQKDGATHPDLIDAAIERGQAYAEAGASGFFVPGLVAPELISRVVEAVRLPVNVMSMPGAATRSSLATLGVARISHGPFPYWRAMAKVKAWAAEAMA
ncbi:isocitrate lyase/PEP mutase family protein [Maricaulis maris]|uniref:2-methylisocitrate lyase-like PEP mutase family enzyme n=1 Tax=Maricaulis maris TaxID=74318 RepID=A0A495DJG1_9PROT|nr:isocitrate lyase/phosphoenolpyruvate mutase family protein [Maricaulis maris]RKR02722.1 2-methylisocitrate lyase-like PEP mutase family enzyme [Maricaulis maris]